MSSSIRVCQQPDEITKLSKTIVLDQPNNIIAADQCLEAINQKALINKKRSKFVVSRGCPIRCLVNMEFHQEESALQVPNVDLLPDVVVAGTLHLADPSQIESVFNQLDQVSEVFVNHEIFSENGQVYVIFPSPIDCR